MHDTTQLHNTTQSGATQGADSFIRPEQGRDQLAKMQADRGGFKQFDPIVYELHVSRIGSVDEIHGPFTADEIINVQTKLSSTNTLTVRVVKRYGRQQF